MSVAHGNASFPRITVFLQRTDDEAENQRALTVLRDGHS